MSKKSRTVNIRPSELANIITNKEIVEEKISTATITADTTNENVAPANISTTSTTTKESVTLMNTKTEVVVPKTQAKQMPTPVLFIKEYINSYVNYQNQKSGKSVSESISKFKNIIIYALSHQEDAVLSEVYSFFKRYRSIILAPEIALQGLYTLPSAIQDKLQVVYMLFYHITGNNKRAKKLDLDHAIKVLGNGNIISFVAKRMQ